MSAEKAEKEKHHARGGFPCRSFVRWVVENANTRKNKKKKRKRKMKMVSKNTPDDCLRAAEPDTRERVVGPSSIKNQPIDKEKEKKCAVSCEGGRGGMSDRAITSDWAGVILRPRMIPIVCFVSLERLSDSGNWHRRTPVRRRQALPKNRLPSLTPSRAQVGDGTVFGCKAEGAGRRVRSAGHIWASPRRLNSFELLNMVVETGLYESRLVPKRAAPQTGIPTQPALHMRTLPNAPAGRES
ncbi:hypothetical protein LZ30DRAFT_456596 [Colletotrichum cereale]|nr:hypothetical protein LZ30DRAFT_456596 [Colletotrichum cereale]